MKYLILWAMIPSVSFLYAQQTEGLKVEKTTRTSILERKVADKPNDSIAKSNLNNILKQQNKSSSIFGSADQYNSEIQENVNKLQNNVNSFNNNTFNRMPTQGTGIQLKKRK